MVKLFQRLPAALVAIGALAIAPGSFANDNIRVYDVPKGHPAVEPAAGATTAAGSGLDVNSAPIHWTTPDSWKELAPTSVRIGNFLVAGTGDKKAEVAITSFPGNVGGEVENVNRWRREIGLSPVTAPEISSTKAEVGSGEAKLYEFTGASARTVVAWLQRDGNSWFFKLRGDKGVVTDAQPTFIKFLKTISFAANGGAPAASVLPTGDGIPQGDPGQLPAGHPDISSSATAAPSEPVPGEPKWSVPSNWQEKAPGPMVLKSFSVQNHAGLASIAISSFPGDVGGKLANVNRWRGQMGLKKIEESELATETQSIDVVGGKATLVDMKGTDAKSGKAAHLVAVMVPHADETWFYKLTGEDTAVAHEKENFLKFVQTVRY